MELLLSSIASSYEKPANTFRILNLGDSVAMGWGVREEETYGQQLEQLSRREWSPFGIGFIPSGVSSSG